MQGITEDHECSGNDGELVAMHAAVPQSCTYYCSGVAGVACSFHLRHATCVTQSAILRVSYRRVVFNAGSVARPRLEAARVIEGEQMRKRTGVATRTQKTNGQRRAD